MTSKRPIIISIEGNIGAGKTTILAELEKYIATHENKIKKKIMFLKEPVDIWEAIKDDETGENILQKFYSDPHKYAFSFQVMAYSTRLRLIRKAVRENPDCDIIICERSLEADKQIFAQMLSDDGVIGNVEYKIYKQFCSEFSDEFGLSGVIYIDADAEVCYKRVNKRRREGEDAIPLDYLQKCKDYHDQWLIYRQIDFTPTKNSTKLSVTNSNPSPEWTDLNHQRFKLLRIDTNPDIEYNLTDSNNFGAKWLFLINEFIGEFIEDSDKNCDFEI
jgi:deoxycitidine kinase/deoxyguanosine kinase